MDVHSREFEDAVLTRAAEIVQGYVPAPNTFLYDPGVIAKHSCSAIMLAAKEILGDLGSAAKEPEAAKAVDDLLTRYRRYVMTCAYADEFREYCVMQEQDRNFLIETEDLSVMFFNGFPDPQAERVKSLNMFNYACGKFA